MIHIQTLPVDPEISFIAFSPESGSGQGSCIACSYYFLKIVPLLFSKTWTFLKSPGQLSCGMFCSLFLTVCSLLESGETFWQEEVSFL